jgi:hypothetical protein
MMDNEALCAVLRGKLNEVCNDKFRPSKKLPSGSILSMVYQAVILLSRAEADVSRLRHDVVRCKERIRGGCALVH